MVARLVLAALFLFPLVAQARERAVLIYPKERAFWFRRVFYTSHQRELREQLASEYDLEVHEQVATDDDLFATDVDGAKLLVLSAHGDAHSMHFAGRKVRTLDFTDRERLTAFLDRLDPFATIVLQSCYTGRGFAHLVKEAAGPTRRVIAAQGMIPWDGLRITSVSPFEVTIRCRDKNDSEWDCTMHL